VASVVSAVVSTSSAVSGTPPPDPEPTPSSLPADTPKALTRCYTTTSGVEVEVEMRPQPHGGALRRGNPGNSGGTGVTKELREAFRGDLEVARRRIVGILADDDADPKDLIAIFDKLAKYSVGEKRDGVTVDHDLLNELFEPVQRCVRDSSELMGIREQWLDVLGRRLRA